jgi:cytochrome bd ubiquinol oxidase subunit II
MARAARVPAVIVAWAIAQRPEFLPGLTVEEAAADRAVLVATIGGVAVGAIVLVPSLAILFGLVLRGRFDREAIEAEVQRDLRGAQHRRLLLALAAIALIVGLPSLLVASGGLLQVIGVVALMTFIALGSIGLISAAVTATSPIPGADTKRRCNPSTRDSPASRASRLCVREPG